MHDLKFYSKTDDKNKKIYLVHDEINNKYFFDILNNYIEIEKAIRIFLIFIYEPCFLANFLRYIINHPNNVKDFKNFKKFCEEIKKFHEKNITIYNFDDLNFYKKNINGENEFFIDINYMKDEYNKRYQSIIRAEKIQFTIWTVVPSWLLAVATIITLIITLLL